MLRILLISLMLPAVAAAEYVGFSHGPIFSATPIHGQVNVTCNGFNGTGSAVYTCRDVVLDPQAYDVFTGPRDARAVLVELKSTLENGTLRERSSGYEGARGRSTESFNLWISTLFQKALLGAGKNQVEYILYSDERGRNELTRGQFTVTVGRGSSRQCPLAHYQSTDINDCQSQYSICQRYFQEFKNCK